jgi:hypothetical protein
MCRAVTVRSIEGFSRAHARKKRPFTGEKKEDRNEDIRIFGREVVKRIKGLKGDIQDIGHLIIMRLAATRSITYTKSDMLPYPPF